MNPNKLFWNVRIFVLRRLNTRQALKTRSRKDLEYNLFYYLHSEIKPKKVLFIGCGPYTCFYPKILPHTELHTLDKDPSVASWGSPQRHYHIDIASKEARELHPSSYDAIIFNGVYGWGVNTTPQLKNSLDNVARLLKPSGFLIFGWNRTPQHDPLNVNENISHFFGSFKVSTLNNMLYIQSNKYYQRHCYRFFKLLPI